MKSVQSIFKLITTFSLIIISCIAFSGCVAGVVSEDNYCDLIAGVNAEIDEKNSVYYEMRTLVDNIEFNSNIQIKPYCKLDIMFKKSCQIKGIVFIVRSSKNCTLKFTTFIDGSETLSRTKALTKNVMRDVDMLFVMPKNIAPTSEVFVQIKELDINKNEEKTEFAFDSLIVFLQE
ncbi:MAG: hypothetical protein RR247_04070 [Clostridia bacterium]